MINEPNFSLLLNQSPKAVADVNGSEMYPNLKGSVWFYNTKRGVLVVADIDGLPSNANVCKSPIFAFHIHSGESCMGNMSDQFADAMTHYNPNNCPHPYHAGDLPPLFGANGYAFSVVLTDRFTIDEVIGKTVIIHANVDDFVTQPSGNSGPKIACGVIHKI